jgi:arginine deiminase
MRCYVGSEVGPLRRVLLHRPDIELRRLTPSNRDELLFDDVPWVKRARQEHDTFADALTDRGVEVLYLADLLAETMKHDEARGWLLDQVVREDEHGPVLAPVLRTFLENLDERSLTRVLIGGVTRAELGGIVPVGSLDVVTKARGCPGTAKPRTSAPSTASTRCSPTRRSTAGTTVSASTVGWRRSRVATSS